jgi:hypothetical protein
MFTAAPNSIAMTGAGVPTNQFTLTGPVWLAGDILAGSLLREFDAGAIRVPHESLLDLLMLGMDPIGEGLEAEQVVIDSVVNGRVGIESVWSRESLFGERDGDRGDGKRLQDVASCWGHGVFLSPVPDVCPELVSVDSSD